LLKSSSDIGGVADRRRVHRQSVAERAKDDRPGVNTDPYRQSHPLGIGSTPLVATQSLLDGERRQQRTPYVILLRHRRAEQRHKAVTAELRSRPSIAMHFGQAHLEKRGDEVAHRLSAEARGHRRGADNVAEQHADLLHFAGERRPRGRHEAGRFEWRPALAAEPVFRRVGGSA